MIDSRAARHFDFLLVLFAACLVVFGGLLIYSAQLSEHPGGVNLAHPLTKQLVFAAFGLCLVFAVLMLVAVLVIGDSAYGSRRWFTFAGQQIQASEIAKLFVIVALARYLADR